MSRESPSFYSTDFSDHSRWIRAHALLTTARGLILDARVELKGYCGLTPKLLALAKDVEDMAGRIDSKYSEMIDPIGDITVTYLTPGEILFHEAENERCVFPDKFRRKLFAAIRERDAEIARLRKAAKWAATMLGGASLPGWKRGEIGNLFKHFCEEYPDLAPGAK